VETVQDKR